MSTEPEPVSDERLRQAVRDVLAEELDQSDGDQPNATRRQVLGSIAAGGVLGGLAGAGSAAGATSEEDTSGMVGALAGPPYKVADPGLFSGPDASKGSISHSVGQVHFAQDTGARYYDDGSNWDLLPLRTGRVNNTVNAAEQAGSDLGTQVDNAVSALSGNRGKIRIPPTDDGSAYTWSTDVTITPPNDTGLAIQVAEGVEINYSGSGWMLTLEEAGWGGSIPPVHILGGKWLSTGTDPDGGIRLNDSRNCFISPRYMADWTNSTDDCQAIVYRNVDSFCERNFSGWVKFSDCDICYDTEPATVTGGTGGGPSFVDNMWFWPSMQYREIGIRIRGSHSGNVVDQGAFFPKENGAVGAVLDGAVDGMIFREPRFDDPTDAFTGTIAWQTGSSYQQGIHVRNPRYNNIDTELDKNSSGHRVLLQRTINDATSTRYEIGELGGSRWIISGTGDLEIYDSTDTSQFQISNSGNFQDVGNFNDAPRFVNRTEYATENLSGQTGSITGEVAMDDGTNTTSGDPALCVWNGTAWRIMSEDTTFS